VTRVPTVLAAAALVVLASAVHARIAATSVVLGTLAGPGGAPAPAGVQFYGTDLGWTFEHEGQLLVLFGDTWPYARFPCDVVPENDDCQATLPMAPPAGVPPLTFLTRADAPDELDPIRVFRGPQSLDMGFGRTPVAGFSDGTDAFGLFIRPEYVPCAGPVRRGKVTCRPHRHLACSDAVGVCTPAAVGQAPLCDLANGAGCLPGQTCTPSGDGFCFDPKSSQHDGTNAGVRAAAALVLDLAVQDATAPASWHSVATLTTNKFLNTNGRTVTRFRGRLTGDDYAPGTGALLLWGRPGFSAAEGREAQVYLLRQTLPLRRDRRGRVRLTPRFFAGVDARNKPRWTRREASAVPLALDGVVGGSPREVQPIVMQMTITWVGPPVSKWVMLYGGDLADYLLVDPANARPGDAPGAVRIRYADRPWGPWTPPEPLLRPGSPSVPGDPYGPGGVLFHVDCEDQGPALCARSDPTRPTDPFLPGCPELGRTFDVGRFYAPNVIDAYTRSDGAGGVEIFWNVSTWNPYAVVFVRTTLRNEP
jgi:hypothetical protein